MTRVSHTESGRPARRTDPVPPSQPVTTTAPPDPAAAPVEAGAGDRPDKSNWLWCRGCNSPQPPEGRKGFRCAACAAKAKKSPNRWTFDQHGNVISRGRKK